MKRGKKAILNYKGIDILSELDGIPLFGQECLWKHFLNSIIPKFFLKSINNQYAKHTSHKFLKMCTRTVGNLALKQIWKAFIHAKVEYLSFKKIQEIISEDNI